MKWATMLNSFLTHAIVGTVGSGLLMLSKMYSGYGGIFVMFVAPVIGIACGLVGLVSGYYASKKDYVTSTFISTLLAVAVAILVLHLLF